MLDRSATGFQQVRTCLASLIGPTSPGVVPVIPAMPGPVDDRDGHPRGAPRTTVTDAPAPGARPGPGMASTVRRGDVDPSASGLRARGRAEGSPWPRRICPVCSATRRSSPRGPARPPI